MKILEDLGNWLEKVSDEVTNHTFEQSEAETWTEAELRTFDRATNIRELGRFLNGKTAEDTNI